MENNISHIKLQPKVPNETIINQLKYLLEKAERAEISGIVIVSRVDTDEYRTFYGGMERGDDYIKFSGMLEFVKSFFMKKIMSNSKFDE